MAGDGCARLTPEVSSLGESRPQRYPHAAGTVGSGRVAMMLASLSEIGLDSNCLSYVIDALEGVSEPTDNLAAQRVALVRSISTPQA